MNQDMVVKSNKLIEAAYDITVAEQKILLSAITRVRRDEPVTDEVMYTITANSLADMSGFAAKHEYRNLAAAASRLFNRVIIIKDGTETEETRWVQTCRYKPDQGCVELRFSKDILPYLNQLTERFTQYKLQNVIGMKSSYGIRLYELLMQWQSIGEREISLEAFKEMLGIKPEQYKTIQNLKARVINAAVKDVNTHSDLKVEWGQRKTGRRVTHLQFQFGPKDDKKAAKRLTNDQIAAQARPGETWEQARDRLR